MTNEQFGDEIPELVASLEDSLSAPNPAAIHAGLGQRQAVRKRMLGAAGALVAVLGITAGALALTNNDATSTVTADDTGDADAAGDDSDFTQAAVGADSAPKPDGGAFGFSKPFPATVNVADCANTTSIRANGSLWLGNTLTEIWEDRESFAVTAITQDGVLIAVDTDGNAAGFWRQEPNIEMVSDCRNFVEVFNGTPADLAPGSFSILSAFGEVPVEGFSGGFLIEAADKGESTLFHSARCAGSSGYKIRWNDVGFTVVGTAPQPQDVQRERCSPAPLLDVFNVGDEVVVTVSPGLTFFDITGDSNWQVLLDSSEINTAEMPNPTPLPTPAITIYGEATVITAQCANDSRLTFQGVRWAPRSLPSAWRGQEMVDVTIEWNDSPLIATDDAGNSAPFWSDDGSGGDDYCAGYNLAQQSPPTTVPVETTTTLAPQPTGPPTFAPSSDLGLSGEWTPVGMWDDGAPLDLTGFGGSITIFGRRLSGNDGCNSQGAGIFYAQANGQASLQIGNTTDVGCPTNLATFDAFNAGTLGATQWGRTAERNLVLTNGIVVIEFELSEGVPAASLNDLSAPLNTIWRNGNPSDYESLPADGGGVTLTFSADADGFEVDVIAVVTVADCGEFGFAATYEDGTEGTISFEPLSDANPADCELSEIAQLALDALPRADYFATAEGGLGLWVGPLPVASFVEEAE